MRAKIARNTLLLGVLVAGLVACSGLALAGDVVVTLGGTVEPPTLAVTVTPQHIDLSSKAGDAVDVAITFSNVGNLPAKVEWSRDAIAFSASGLTPVSRSEAENAIVQPSPETADRCMLRFEWTYDPPYNGQTIWYDGRVPGPTDFLEQPISEASWDQYYRLIRQLAPEEESQMYLHFATSRYLSQRVEIAGSITFTVSEAQP
ncbi:MAG: hypothetical protein ACPLRW_07465 [Moorellales bacterium]